MNGICVSILLISDHYIAFQSTILVQFYHGSILEIENDVDPSEGYVLF